MAGDLETKEGWDWALDQTVLMVLALGLGLRMDLPLAQEVVLVAIDQVPVLKVA